MGDPTPRTAETSVAEWASGASTGKAPGPERRFEEVFDASHRRLLAFVARRVDPICDAADIVAETYLVAWRRIGDVPEGDAAIPWLFAVARRLLSNHYRGQQRRLALADRVRTAIEAAPPPPPPGTAVIDVLATLSPEDQEILRLDAWDGLKPQEIAQVMDISSSAARVRLHRARRRLAARLDTTPARSTREDPS